MVMVLTDLEDRSPDRVDGFITGLSSLNFVFAFAMNLFNYTILVLLEDSGFSVVYGGLGISLGQAILLLLVIPMGRAVDRGRSYSLMAAGSILYGAVLVSIYFSISLKTAVSVALVIAFVSLVILFQNMFKSSLSSFVAKAVRAKIMGKSYSRIIWMETAGGTLSFFIVEFAHPYFSLAFMYIIVGLVMLVVSAASFTILAKENRNALKLTAGNVPRPTFRESISALMARGRFTVTLLSTKVLMSIGVLGFSYFYIVIGKGIGVQTTVSLLFLGIASALGIFWGILAERFVVKHPGWGKSYIVLMAVLDVVSYTMILIAMDKSNSALYLAAPLIGSPGPFLIPGAMAYEVKVIGRENRGIFAGIQRTFTGIPAIVLGAPLAYVFTVNPVYMWIIILASSAGTLFASLLIPSRKYLEEKYGVREAGT